MRQYETMIIMNPELQGDALDVSVKEAQGIIKKYQGEVESVNDLGKRALNYDIKKKSEGFYYLIKFKCDPKQTKEIKRELSLSDNILRAMVTVVGE